MKVVIKCLTHLKTDFLTKKVQQKRDISLSHRLCDIANWESPSYIIYVVLNGEFEKQTILS